MDFVYAPLLFPLAFLGMWSAVIFIVSHAGWRTFAEHYPARAASGTTYLARHARFGSVLGTYHNAVRVSFRSDGIYFSMLFPFRPFHQPFLVPWTSVRSAERSHILFMPRLRVAIDDPCGTIRLWLPAAAEQDVRRYLPFA